MQRKISQQSMYMFCEQTFFLTDSFCEQTKP